MLVSEAGGGRGAVTLTIEDQLGATETETRTLVVAPDTDAPGTLLEVYSGTPLSSLGVSRKTFVALLPDSFALKEDPGIGGDGAVVRLVSRIYFSAGSVTIAFNGWSGSAEIRIDGAIVGQNPTLAAGGLKELDIRCAPPRRAVLPCCRAAGRWIRRAAAAACRGARSRSRRASGTRIHRAAAPRRRASRVPRCCCCCCCSLLEPPAVLVCVRRLDARARRSGGSARRPGSPCRPSRLWR